MASYSVIIDLIMSENSIKIIDRLLDFNCNFTLQSIIVNLKQSNRTDVLSSEYFYLNLPKILSCAPEEKKQDLVDTTHAIAKQFNSPTQLRLNKIFTSSSFIFDNEKMA